MHTEPQSGSSKRLPGLRSWHALGTWQFAARLAAIGGIAAFTAWVVVFAAHLIFDVSKPTVIALLWAILPGALFGVALGFILRAYWNRSQTREEASERLWKGLPNIPPQLSGRPLGYTEQAGVCDDNYRWMGGYE